MGLIAGHFIKERAGEKRKSGKKEKGWGKRNSGEKRNSGKKEKGWGKKEKGWGNKLASLVATLV